jgi:Zn2+/Cd2+-exporting ATPase
VDTGRLVVSYDPAQVSEDTIVEQIQALGYTIGTAKPTAKKAHDHSAHDHSGHDHSGHDPASHDHSSHDHAETRGDDENNDVHNHSSGAGDFDLKAQLPPVLFSVALFAIATLWEKPLHDTP